MGRGLVHVKEAGRQVPRAQLLEVRREEMLGQSTTQRCVPSRGQQQLGTSRPG